MNNQIALRKIKERRVFRVRAKISGSKSRPRLAVFRSNKYISAQLIDDKKGTTLIACSSREEKGGKKITKEEAANNLGKILAEKALKDGIKEVVFDRRSYQYHGRIKALAEGARKAGLKF